MLKKYREEIDVIDKEIKKLLIRRFEYSEKIGQYKKKRNLPLSQQEREEEILSSLETLPYNKFLMEVYLKIFEESKKLQQEQLCTD